MKSPQYFPQANNCAELIDIINRIGFLPLLRMPYGWSAEEIVNEECRYIQLDNGGWEWRLWRWKGDIIRDGGCAYGRFFESKATFISREWWQDFCNYRRSRFPMPEIGGIDDIVLQTIRECGSVSTSELRDACGFSGAKMKSKFNTCLQHLENGCHIVTEDFVYKHNRHGKEYGWGESVLTTPEHLFGKMTCTIDRSPEESRERIVNHFQRVMPFFDRIFVDYLLK